MVQTNEDINEIYILCCSNFFGDKEGLPKMVVTARRDHVKDRQMRLKGI